MDRILHRLYLGSTRDLSAPSLRTLGFSAAVDLRSETSPIDVPTCHLANRDGDPWSEAQIEITLAFIHQHVRTGRVLVACAAGMSRSASMVIGYLVRCGIDAPTAFSLVRRARPKIAPVPGMLEAVLRVAERTS